jgi:hypothetical protein
MRTMAPLCRERAGNRIYEGKVGSHGNEFKASDSTGDVVRHVNACGLDAT